MVLRSGVEVPHPPPARHSGPLRERLSKYKYDFQLLSQGWYSLALGWMLCYVGRHDYPGAPMPDLKSLTPLRLPAAPCLSVSPQSPEVTLFLDGELRERLERQRQIVAGGRAAREFGVVVDVAMVARIALIRGLERMEDGTGAGTVAGAVAGTDNTAESVSTDPVDHAHQGPPAGESLSVDYNEEGEIAPPEGWNKWNGTERIPSEQQEVHDYYIGQGLWRYWGKSGDQIFTFYWSPKKSLSDVVAYESVDVSDRRIALQQTPWGPGHILPKYWGLSGG